MKNVKSCKLFGKKQGKMFVSFFKKVYNKINTMYSCFLLLCGFENLQQTGKGTWFKYGLVFAKQPMLKNLPNEHYLKRVAKFKKKLIFCNYLNN